MKFTAIGVVLMGVVIAGVAGFQYATGGPPEKSVPPSPLTLELLLSFAAVLILAGGAMWRFGGKGYSLLAHRFGPPRTDQSAVTPFAGTPRE